MSPKPLVIGLLLALFATAQAQQPAVPPTLKVEVLECLVYSSVDASKRHDCTAKAREVCNGVGATCELPIGLALSDGKDLDGNAKTWEKVRVTFQCGPLKRVSGPHDQNEHAVAVLACRGF
jgi:hypothetical protein